MKKISAAIKLLLYSSTLFFITFCLLPSEQVFAHFTDSASVSAGIKLTLGNLALSPEKDEPITGLIYSGGDPVVLASHLLKNQGTLAGKLAYHVQVTEKGSGVPVDDKEMQLILSFDSVLGDKIIPAEKINTSGYTFITGNEGDDWIFEADENEAASVTIKYKNTVVPVKDRDLDITVTFLLVQTNATEPKEAMFYDKVSFKHELKLKAKEESAPIDPDYWPVADDKNWKWNKEVRYNDAQFEKIMYISEVETGENIRNLNDNVLYIELPEGKTKEDTVFGITHTEGSHIKAEVMENKRHIKVTFSFDKLSKNTETIVSQPNYYTVGFNYGENNSSYVNFQPNLLPLVYKRILLNTDENIPSNFKILPIYTTLEKKKITFKYAQEDDLGNANYLTQPLSDALLTYQSLSAEIKEGSALFELSVYKSTKEDGKDYLLLNTNHAVDGNKKGTLKIILVGNNGNRLVIYRDLMITKETRSVALSRTINQNEENLNLEIKETQAESEEDAAEELVETKETAEQNESIQDSTSEETTATDSSIVFPEGSVDDEESTSLKESVQESSEKNAAAKQDVKKEESSQENKIE